MGTDGSSHGTTLTETLAVFEGAGESGEPLTATEVAERLDCSRGAAAERLETLAERGDLGSKETGALGRVWWRRPGDGAADRGDGSAETDSTAPDVGTDRDSVSARDLVQLDRLVEEIQEYAIFLLDEDGHVRTWNQGAERITGYEREEVLGEHLATFYTEADREADLPARNLARAREQGTLEDEGWRVQQDGTQFWASVTVTPIRDEADTVRGYAVVTRDTTDRHRDEERLREQRDELDDLNRINEVIRDVDHSLVSATSRAEIERAVCERLAAADSYCAASVAERTVDGLFETRTTAGVDADLSASADADGGTACAAADEALDAETVQVVTDESVDGITARHEAVAMVPLVHEGEEFGVLAVYSNEPTSFDERKTTVLRELGETTAHAMAAIRHKEREERLTALHDASRRLVDADSHEAVGEVVVEAVTEDLGMDDAHVYHFDTDRNTLEQVSTSVLFRSQAERSHTLTSGDDSPVWSSFVAGETAVHGPDAGPILPGQSLHRRTEALVPLGDHGVLVAATDDADRLDPDRHHLLELLAATAEAALDHLDSQAALRERDAILQERNEHLQRLNKINTIIRDIDQALVQATTDEEILRVVCEELTRNDRFRFAWIGEANDEGDRLLPRAWSGDGRGYLDSAGVESVCPVGEPAGRAFESGEVTVVSNVADDLHSATWRSEAFGREFQSVISVPLTYGDVSYGVLSVYAARPDVFGEMEQSVFAELGRTIANAINAVETKRALLNDQMVELEFSLAGDSTSFLTRLAGDTGGDVTFEGAVPVSDEEARVFFTVRGASADEVRSVVDEFVTVDTARLVSSEGEGLLFEAVVSGSPVPLALLDQNATLLGLSASAEEARLVVGLPSSTDVRNFIERFLERYEGAEFVARRERETPVQSREGFRFELGETLTDRQLEVLKTAYLSGYFASPRASTGSELGETLDISQPTVTEHLRAAQGKLLDLLFADDPTMT